MSARRTKNHENPPDHQGFHNDEGALVTVARNVSTIYIAVIIDSLLGLLILPFNVTHLGTSAYGLWVLTASVTLQFSLLDLGYGGALVKFVAHYRAHKDARALNEIASTLFVVFALVGCVAYGVGALVAFHLGDLFKITPEQAEIGKWVLLTISIHVALNFPFNVFGGVVTGFQRQHVNGTTAVASSILVSIVNVAMLSAGYGLVALVIATTTVRVLTFFVYASNAYRVFPALSVSPRLFRWSRLKEVTGFSVYSSIIDWSYKLSYQFDQLVVGAFLGVAPVAVWAVAERIIGATQNLTIPLSGVLFPVIVDSDASERGDRLQQILIEGTRLSLATVLPIAVSLIVLGDRLVLAWVGAKKPELLASVPVLQILAVAVAVRVGNGTAATLLKGAGRHRMLASVNLATALSNVGISVALVRVWGLVGVAVGTLVTVAFTASVILFPAACRRVGLPLRTALLRAVLPAVWPALVVGVALSSIREIATPTFVAVAAQMAFGGLLYLALFVIAVGSRDRTMYVARLQQVLDRRLVALT